MNFLNSKKTSGNNLVLFFRFFCILLLSIPVCYGQQPTRLTTDLLEHTDRVFFDGAPTGIKLSELKDVIERYQLAFIRNPNPYLGWVVNSDQPNTLQRAYRILLASSPDLLTEEKVDMWDSGRTESNNSVAIRYSGKPLLPSSIYYWKVKTWDNHGVESTYAQPKSFHTAAVLDGETSRYPLQATDEYPIKIEILETDHSFIDFGKATFGKLRLTLTSHKDNDTVIIHLGERVREGRIDRHPGGSIRYSYYKLPLMPGTHTYQLKIRPDKRNTDNHANVSGVKPMRMPDYMGEVYPFRACEIENYQAKALKINDIVRQTVHYPFDELASLFNSSDSVLNQIWALSKHSLNATTFTGTYIDGDRERIPYEREALISQLGHYNVDREFSIARHSHEYLIHNPTWPTEWNMQSVWMAWNDYLYTGNSFSLEKHYPALKAKTLLSLREENGLISTRTGKQTQDFLNSINFKGKALQDIVDWPHTGILGLEKNEAGETDGFIFSDYNNVVNAYHYKSLCLMSMIAEALGKEKDKIEFIKLANQFKKDFNRAFLDMEKGYYNDGIGIDHSSLHGNMFPLVFGLVPDKNIETTLKFIRSRKMACSISNALFLMETLYENNDAEYALKLLSSVKERSWYNTIRIGSTLTIEAWDNKYKPNLDWNQSAGSAPASIIARKLMGIEPLMPGFEKIRVKPQPSTLNYAEIKLPTVRGEVYVAFNNIPNEVFSMNVRIPANTTAEIWLPLISKKYTLIVNGNLQKGMEDGNFIKVELGSGEHSLAVN